MPKRRRKSSSGKRNSWKKLKVSYKFKRQVSLFFMAIVVVISTAVVFALISLWQFFKTPFAKAADFAGSAESFQEEQRYNILLVLLEDKNDSQTYIKGLSLLSLSPPTQSVSLLSIPPQVEIEAVAGLGQVRVESLHALGGLTEPRKNTEVMTKSISAALALPIDSYLITDQAGLQKLVDILGVEITGENIEAIFTFRHFLKILDVFKTIRSETTTNISLKDGWQITRFLSGTRSDRIDSVRLTAQDFENFSLLDEQLQALLRDENIFNERLKVVVLNGTERPGLAGKAARFVENLGGSVLSVENFGQEEQKVSFILTKQRDSYLLKRLSGVFGIRDIRDQQAGVGERAEIVIVVGLDMGDDL